jgi:hypothetical protein
MPGGQAPDNRPKCLEEQARFIEAFGNQGGANFSSCPEHRRRRLPAAPSIPGALPGWAAGRKPVVNDGLQCICTVAIDRCAAIRRPVIGEGVSMTTVRDKIFSPGVCVGHRQVLAIFGLVALLTVAISAPVRAQEDGAASLPNLEIEYTYEELGTVVLRLGDGVLGYVWKTGAGAGNQASNMPYQSRKIGEQLYLVNWHDVEKEDYVVLVIDLGALLVHGSALWAYETEHMGSFFGKATISRVERLEH